MYQRYYVHRFHPTKLLKGQIDIKSRQVFLENGETKNPVDLSVNYRPLTKEQYEKRYYDLMWDSKHKWN